MGSRASPLSPGRDSTCTPQPPADRDAGRRPLPNHDRRDLDRDRPPLPAAGALDIGRLRSHGTVMTGNSCSRGRWCCRLSVSSHQARRLGSYLSRRLSGQGRAAAFLQPRPRLTIAGTSSAAAADWIESQRPQAAGASAGPKEDVACSPPEGRTDSRRLTSQFKLICSWAASNVEHVILAAAVAGDAQEPRGKRAERLVQGFLAGRQRVVAGAAPVALWDRPRGHGFFAGSAPG